MFLIDIKRFIIQNTKYCLRNSAALHDLFHHNKNQFLLFQKTINYVNFTIFINNNKAIKEK